MKLIDQKFTDTPFYGVERMTDYLKYDLGYRVNEKRVRRLYRLMNLRTIYPKRNLSKANPADYKYPYLLRKLVINRPCQVWQADITYIPMFRGFMYMFAIIDVYSRKIMGWSTSNTMHVEWCKEVLQNTIKEHGCPEIFNTDQGAQFTSPIFINQLKANNIRISMDGKGRALDNIYIERFWRSLKREKIYLNPPNGGIDLYAHVKDYILFYNTQRRHKSIGKITPDEMYYKQIKNVS
ncbi:IS3 family transposase [Sphingobacterium cellulitidis]|uniref:IS3 family transposase n=1 Tax=Sphingobacterium cellulitidis TaxID=1768011 RepID=UPI00370D82D2